MKFKLALVALSLLAVLVVTAMPVMAKPTTLAVPWYQAQFQWRASPIANPPQIPFGDWSDVYQNYYTSDEPDVFTLTGNVLHETFTYLPAVTNPVGLSTVYVYNKAEGKWIQHEGTISYTSPYSGLTITEYWRGYLDFSGTPAADSFNHGVSYQWSYVYGIDETTVKTKYPIAVWDETMGAWLVGFSIYLYDPTATQSYTTPFPSPFIEPVPASNCNPLNL